MGLISLFRSKAKQVKETSAWVEIPSVRVCECVLCAYFVFTNPTMAQACFINIKDAASRSRSDWMAPRAGAYKWDGVKNERCHG